MPSIDGKTLREWRRSRGWDVPQLARQLRRTSKEPIAAHDALVRMIRSWERGTHALSERYELLYRSLGLPDASASGFASAPMLPAPISPAPVPPAAMPLTPLPSAGDVPAQVLPAPDDQAAERFLLARKALRDNDNLFGPREVIPIAVRQLEVIRQQSEKARGPDRSQLLLPQIQFADLLGWLYQDSCEYGAAAHWLDRALEWAHVLGDRRCVAFILARKSQLAGDMRDGSTAIATAEAAMHLAGRRNLIGSVAATYAAHGHALDGQAAAAGRLYDKARIALGGTADTTPSWATFLDYAYIDVHEALSLTILGDHAAAATTFRAAISGLRPRYHRDRGVYLARQARAHAGMGEHEHAAGLALQALAIGTETRSARIFTELAHVHEAVRPAGDCAAVARFRFAMAAARCR
jgi:tetratricopeptide (TPR) repeat protein